MSIFNLFKAKKSNPFEEIREKMMNSMFPKGPKDIDAGAKELLYILNNKIDIQTSRTIFMKSYTICTVAEKFDVERLKTHLKGYCIQHFEEKQIEQFYSYLVALNTAMTVNRRTPSEVRREGNSYLW